MNWFDFSLGFFGGWIVVVVFALIGIAIDNWQTKKVKEIKRIAGNKIYDELKLHCDCYTHTVNKKRSM